jgi:hypothetical protein
VNRTFVVWALSVVGGVAIAFFLLTYGVRALLLLGLALIAATRVHERWVAIGGQLIGLGGAIVLTQLPWIARCAGAGEGAAGCRISTAYEIWLFAAAMFIVGGALLAFRRTA